MRVSSLTFILLAFVGSTTNAQVKSGYAGVNGIRMYYEIHGEGQTPVVLIHGGGSTIETSFHYLLPLLLYLRLYFEQLRLLQLLLT